jgi:acyl dehydratase
MVQNAHPIGPQHYRESFGRYYEDFQVGDIYEHRPGRTITQTDNTWFTLLTMNTNELHFNVEYGNQAEFGKPLVVSPLTLAIASGQSVTDLTQNAIANLGWDEIKMTHPVYADDTIWSESLVLEKRESSSRPHAGVVSRYYRASALGSAQGPFRPWDCWT